MTDRIATLIKLVYIPLSQIRIRDILSGGRCKKGHEYGKLAGTSCVVWFPLILVLFHVKSYLWHVNIDLHILHTE